MYRIDNTSAVPSMPAPGPPGTPGWFTDGNPAAALEATIVDAWWCNIIQEEILTVVQNAGITPNKASHTQLWEALESLYQRGGGNYLPLTGGILYAGPGIATPFGVHSIGMAAGVELFNVGVRNWWIGVLADGHFAIYDATAMNNRLLIDGGGSVSCAANLWVAANVTAAFDVTAGVNMSAGNAIWQGTAPVTPNAISAVDLLAAGNTYLRYTRCYIPGANDPLVIEADGATNQYARIAYYISGKTLWRTGPDPAGIFTIIDDSSGTSALRFWIDTAGVVSTGTGINVTGGSLTVSSALVASTAGGVNVHGGLTVNTGGAVISNSLDVNGVIQASIGNPANIGIRTDGAVEAEGLFAHSKGVVCETVIAMTGPSAAGGSGVLNFWDRQAGHAWGEVASGNTLSWGAASFEGVMGQILMQLQYNGNFIIQHGQAFKPNGGEWQPWTSTRAAKTEIMPYERGLEAILALQPVTYRFNGRYGTHDDGKRYHGLIAEDVQDVMDELVTTHRGKIDPGDAEDSDILTIDASALKYALVNSIKELTRRLEALERRS